MITKAPGRLALLLLVLALAMIGHALYLPAKALLAQELLERAWQQSEQQGTAVKPWPWADTHPVAKISFPSLDREYIVLAGSMGRSLAFAPGHLTGTALPEEVGHMIISAHRDSHFQGLDELEAGDLIEVETLYGVIKRYQVTATSIVDSRDNPLYIEAEKHLLTLLTCYPFDAIRAGGPLRYRLDAVPIA